MLITFHCVCFACVCVSVCHVYLVARLAFIAVWPTNDFGYAASIQVENAEP